MEPYYRQLRIWQMYAFGTPLLELSIMGMRRLTECIPFDFEKLQDNHVPKVIKCIESEQILQHSSKVRC